MAILSRIGVILSVVWSLTATALMAYEIHKFTISHDETEEAKEEDNEEEDDESEAMLPAVDSHALATVYDRKGYYEVFIATLYRFGVCFIAGILGHLSGVCLERAEVSVDHKMRLDLFKSLVNKDVAFFDAHNSGELISRVTYDCNYVSYSVSRNLVTFVQRVIFILSALAFALHYSWRMTLNENEQHKKVMMSKMGTFPKDGEKVMVDWLWVFASNLAFGKVETACHHYQTFVTDLLRNLCEYHRGKQLVSESSQ
ncbi:hypothetical protein ANCDUO_00648 [Ancylostoma duodenale]|uniref:ABC transmembrane type-1 domain-containing protein n=1 Tax=Ancylostoma duodenale TaxID=51022 RepID=A0A0C2E0Z9_9BILA|nr:hypothetical protein ANCDUO_00648 [Ancylostoma duodenale]